MKLLLYVVSFGSVSAFFASVIAGILWVLIKFMQAWGRLFRALIAPPGIPKRRKDVSGAVDVRFGSLADICSAQAHVRFVPIADSCSAAIGIAIRSPRRRDRAIWAALQYRATWRFWH